MNIKGVLKNKARPPPPPPPAGGGWPYFLGQPVHGANSNDRIPVVKAELHQRFQNISFLQETLLDESTECVIN